ncbi:MAG: hypothetical protein J6A27_08630 [Bacteroidales bacterium]|nr:hypothetical protein [Bacteroidales bacterium]
MQHTPTSTADGSSTLQLTQFGETYHSRNGAYTEAMHIYIKNGLEHLFESVANRSYAAPAETPAVGDTSGPDGSPVHLNIFDVGLGTGLNCILTWVWQQQLRRAGLPYPRITYCGIEKYPIHTSEIEQFNYPTIIAQHTDFPPDKLSEIFHLMHSCPWEKDVEVPNLTDTEHPAPLQHRGAGCTEVDFILHKSCADIADLGAEYYREAGRHSWGGDASIPSVVYYDTFSPATQPNLWDETIFRNIASGCTPGSLLVTYCSKGTVKHALRSAGFTLERLPGPPGKRHILRGRL